MSDLSEFQPYLESIRATYEQWWQLYTLTDAAGKQRQAKQGSPPFDFGLVVQTVKKDELRSEEKRREEEKIERFPVLDGIRKYAEQHVLLVGRPGSGKSTALARLMLEEATNPRSRLPVLVELRYWQGSIEQLIRDSFTRHDLPAELVEVALKKSLILFDGVNELPSEEARSQLSAFRRNHPKLPMIFTTRDLSLGGDLGIEKKLEMQPLTEAQMQAFIRAYVPEQVEQMLRQLKDRLRELGQTPLLLWMLCSLFQQTGTIPENLGLVFREFTQGYERYLKEDVRIESDRVWWKPVLEQLAWIMMQGEKPTEFRVAIRREEAVRAISQFLEGKLPYAEDFARKCLRDLQKHHLIQAGTNPEELEFRHQLIQEYYAAEALLEQLPKLDDERLKREFLNYLKWTEPAALMLELVDEVQAVRVVKLALEVDQMLGARLAGEVKKEFQEKTIRLFDVSNAPNWLKVRLLGETHSDNVIPDLLKLVGHFDCLTQQNAAKVIGKISSKIAVTDLLKLVEHPNWNVRESAVSALSRIGSETAIPSLLKLAEHPDYHVRENAARILGEIGSEAAIPGLLRLVEHPNVCVRKNIARALGEIGSETAIPGLLKLIGDSNWEVRRRAAEALGEIDSETAIPGLLKLIEHSDSDIGLDVVIALGEIGSEAAIPGLLKLIEHSDNYVTKSKLTAAEALGSIGSEVAIPDLLKLIEHPDRDVHASAAKALGGIGSEAAILGLLKFVEHSVSSIRFSVAKALSEIGSEAAIPGLLKLIDDSELYVSRRAAMQIHQIDSKIAIPGLFKLVKHPDWQVRDSIAHALLGRISSETDISDLRKLVKHPDSLLRERVAEVLGNIRSTAAVPSLLKLVRDERWFVRRAAAEALGKIGSESTIPGLMGLIVDSHFFVRCSATEALGSIGEAAIPDLLKLIEHPAYDVRSSVAEVLGGISSETAIPGLLKLVDDATECVKSSAAEALGSIGSETAIPDLLKLIEHPAYDVRESAAEALGSIGSEAAIPGLLKLVGDANASVRSSVAKALGKIGSEAAIPGLLKLVGDADINIHLRVRIVEALGGIGSETAIPGLLKLVEHPNYHMRENAARILGEIGSETAIPGLLKLTEHPDCNVRSSVVSVLSKIGSETAILGLLKLVGDTHELVRSSVAEALGKIGSKAAILGLLKLVGEDRPLNVRPYARTALFTLIKKYKDEIAQHLPLLLTLIPTDSGEEALDVILAIQEHCKYYNYEIYQAYLETQEVDRQKSQDSDRSSTIIHNYPNVTEFKQTIMSNSSKYNFPNAQKVQIFEQVTTYIENNHPTDPEVKTAIADLILLLTQLQTQHPQVTTESQALTVLNAEFTEIQQSTTHPFVTLRQQLLNPERHLQAIKATLAEIAKHYLEESVWSKAAITYLDKLSETPDQGA